MNGVKEEEKAKDKNDSETGVKRLPETLDHIIEYLEEETLSTLQDDQGKA